MSGPNLGWFGGVAAIYFVAVLSVLDAKVIAVLGVLALVGFVAYLVARAAREDVASAELEGPIPNLKRALSRDLRCPLCHADFQAAEVAETCSCCETVYHRGCRIEWEVCSTLGCRRRKRDYRSIGEVFQVVAGPVIRHQVTTRTRTERTRTKILVRKVPGSDVLEVSRDESSSAGAA